MKSFSELENDQIALGIFDSLEAGGGDLSAAAYVAQQVRRELEAGWNGALYLRKIRDATGLEHDTVSRDPAGSFAQINIRARRAAARRAAIADLRTDIEVLDVRSGLGNDATAI